MRRRRRQLAARWKPGRASLLPASFLLGFGFGRIPLGMLLFMRRGRASFAGHWQNIAVLYCLKSFLVKVAPGEKMQQEAAAVQPCCWGCGAPRSWPASQHPSRTLCNPLFVADIEKTNQTSVGCRGRGLRHLCWLKSAHTRLFCIAQPGCRDCPAVSESHWRALDSFLVSWTPTLTFSCISAVNCPK